MIFFIGMQVKWIRLLYSDFSVFTKDQESLILRKNSKLDYLEGMVLMHQGPINNWRSSFFPLTDHQRILSLVTQHRVLYCLEFAKYYDHHSENTINKVHFISNYYLFFIYIFYEKQMPHSHCQNIYEIIKSIECLIFIIINYYKYMIA